MYEIYEGDRLIGKYDLVNALQTFVAFDRKVNVFREGHNFTSRFVKWTATS